MYIDIQEEIYDRSLFLVLYQETEIGMVYLWFWQSFFLCIWNRLDSSVKTLVFLSLVR